MPPLNLEALKKQLKPLIFVLLFSMLGFILNLMPINLFANVNLILGNIAFVIVAMRFGVLYSLLSAIIVSTALIYAFGHPFSLIIFSLEAVCIAALRRKGWFVLYADIFYWLLIGMPTSALILYTFSDMPQQFWMLTIVKQAFNGLICCNLAGLIIYFFPKTFAIRFRQQPIVKRTFQVQIVYATTQVIIFSIAMSSLFISQNVIHSLHDNIEKGLQDSKKLVLKQGSLFVEKHQTAIEVNAHTLSLMGSMDEAKLKDIIDYSLHRYPSFATMYVADRHGNIIASSSTNQSNKDYINASIREQDYYKSTIDTSQFHISSVIDRNLDNRSSSEPMVVFSQSFDDHGNGQLRGSLHASMPLRALDKLLPAGLLQNMSYVVTNIQGNTLFSSPELNLESLSTFQFTDKKDLTFRSTGLVTINSNEGAQARSTDYFLTQGKFSNGWHIYVLIDSASVVETVKREYFFIFALLFLSFMISISLAQKISLQLTKPLDFILKQMRFHSGSTLVKSKPLPINSAQEISTLYNEFLQNRKKIIEHQTQLEELVQQRTLELQSANEQLTRLAQKDGLTNVFNRRYFDENFSFFQKLSFRNNNSLAVILLDIDHFKRVNDLHGHLSGDECLRVISSVLSREFARETDLIARYGGEEFVIVVSGISYPNLTMKLEKLRHKIEQTIVFSEENKKIHITASIGAILAEASFAADAQDWIKIADLCLYKAKKSGRNMVLIENFSKKQSKPESEQQLETS